MNTNIQTCEYEYTLDDPPPIKTKKVEKVVYRDVPSGDETIVEVPTYVDVDKVCVCARTHTRECFLRVYMYAYVYVYMYSICCRCVYVYEGICICVYLYTYMPATWTWTRCVCGVSVCVCVCVCVFAIMEGTTIAPWRQLKLSQTFKFSQRD